MEVAASETAGEGKSPSSLAHIRRADKDAADAFAKEAHAWTQQLTARGETLGGLLVDVIEGKSKNGDLVRREMRSVGTWLDGKAAYFATKPAPSFAELAAFRATLLDYIAWEKQAITTGFAEYLKIAEDGNLNRDQKWAKFRKGLQSLDDEEQAWKRKFKDAESAVYLALNRS